MGASLLKLNMKRLEKAETQSNTRKPLIIGVLIVTLILAVIAAITAFKLYQLGLPEKEKEIFEEAPEEYPCRISFVVEATPSASPSPSPSATPSASPSPSPLTNPSPTYDCWSECDYNYQCPSSLECLEVNNINRCVNPSCREEIDCICQEYLSSPSPSPSPVAYVPGESPPPPQQLPQELPEAGVFSPTLIFAIGGLVLIGLGLLL